MNGKKIILITTLVASIILISLTMLFARFVLQIDFTGNDTQQTLENTSGETSSQTQEEDQQTEPSVDQPQSSQSEEENTQTEDENKDEEQNTDQEENPDEEQTAFAPKSTITTAQITITQDDGTEQLTIGQAEEEADQQAEQAKLDQLLQEIQKLQLVSVGQSVALQDANWEASLNLSMEDGTALSCRLYDSTLSGSKTTLSTGSTTYESTESISSIRTLLEGWLEEETQNGLNIAADEFEQASRVLALDLGSMEVQDIAASKAALQEALGALKVTDTLTGSINPGVENTDLTMINLADDEHTLFTFEFYETGILAYRSENNQEFYVCEPASLASFYQTVEQICSQYSSTPASLALMDYGAKRNIARSLNENSMTISSTTGTSRKEVGLIRDHAQTLFSFLQQLHVSKGSVREESVMFSRPEYHADIEFASGMVIRLDINSGSLLIDGGDGVILHYTMIGDSNMDRVRAEFERLIND